MNLTLTEIFADSTHLEGLCSSARDSKELQQILLEAQGTVNAFIRDAGQCMRANLIADTYMLFGEVYSTDALKYFTVVAIIHDRDTSKQRHLFFPFVMALEDLETQPAGLYYMLENAS